MTLTPPLVLSIVAGYFILLIIIAIITSRGASTDDFFVASNQAPWYLVAFGMIGASISGVTFISIPGAVINDSFSYFQVVLGYLLGYLFIGTVLMPLYYRLNLISIYTYLETRYGFWAYKTGAFFFLLSRTVGASFRLFLAAGVLQLGLFNAWGVPFELTTFICVFLIWVYTFKGGIKTIIWTDTFQTTFLISAVIVSIFLIKDELNLGWSALINTVSESPYSQVFFWDWQDNKNFFKQFFAGAFIAIVMTGLDQDLMQKNLSCKNIQEAQKNMFWFTVVLVFVNILFLALGVLLYAYASAKGIALPAKTDDLYPMLAFQHFGLVAGIAFLLGIVASTYASADSALASLTTSFCVDFLGVTKMPEQSRQKYVTIVHISFSILLVLMIILFKTINDADPKGSVVKSLFTAAGYTYGPLLGLFSFGLFTKLKVRDPWVPLACLIAPILSYIININSEQWLFGYKFGFEILIVNGILTFLGLLILVKRKQE
jgi:Na+/proline symporter